MNSVIMTQRTWFLIFIIGLGIMEIETGRIMKKLSEWRYRCRTKFQTIREIYKLWMKVRNKEQLNPKDNDFNHITDTVQQFMNTDTETIARGFDRLKETGGIRNKAIHKLFDVCTKEMGNTTNLVNEMKKQMHYLHLRFK